MSRDPGRARKLTLNPRRDVGRSLEVLGEAVDYPDDVRRPRTRGECADGPRPCPFVSCRHHLYLDVYSSSHGLALNFPDLEPDELEETCSLDVADRGDLILEQVGELMNLTRERIRQYETRLFRKLERAMGPELAAELLQHLQADPREEARGRWRATIP